MLTNGSPSAEQPITLDEVYRQQRFGLAVRGLDLEAENILLQQEVRQLKARVEELELAKFPTPKHHSQDKSVVQ